MVKTIKEDLKDYIVELVKKNVSIDRPYFFIRWSGLSELAKQYGLDILELIDELHNEKRIRKVLIKNRLAITLPEYTVSKKVKQLLNDFEQFRKK